MTVRRILEATTPELLSGEYGSYVGMVWDSPMWTDLSGNELKRLDRTGCASMGVSLAASEPIWRSACEWRWMTTTTAMTTAMPLFPNHSLWGPPHSDSRSHIPLSPRIRIGGALAPSQKQHWSRYTPSSFCRQCAGCRPSRPSREGAFRRAHLGRWAST